MFLNGKEITDLHIPDDITYVSDNAFNGGLYINSVTFTNNIDSIGRRAFRKCGFSSIEIPDCVTKIGAGAFATCPYLKSAKLSNNLVKIEKSLFYNSAQLESVSIGKNTKAISCINFGECPYLKKIYCYADIVLEVARESGGWIENFMRLQRDTMTLYVPDRLINDYKNTISWKYFGEIRGIESSSINSIKYDPRNYDIYNIQGNKLVHTRKGLNIVKDKTGKTIKNNKVIIIKV